MHSITAPDCKAESAIEGMGELLQLRVSAAGVPKDQLACRLPAGEPSQAPSKPAALPVAGGRDALRAFPATWTRVSGPPPLRQRLTKVSRRAGCGKSARPVRRGDSQPRLLSLAVLLYRPIILSNRRESA